MTDEQIIKALECCGKNPPICIECSYKGKYNRKDCYDYLKGDALSLINRQKANAEGLTNAVKILNEQLSSAIVEAVKEFAERLKETLDDFYHTEEDALLDTAETIDNLVKEMVGDAE